MRWRRCMIQMIKTRAKAAVESLTAQTKITSGLTVNSRFSAKCVTSGGMLSAHEHCLAKPRSTSKRQCLSALSVARISNSALILESLLLGLHSFQFVVFISVTYCI